MSDDQQRVAESLDPDELGDDPTGDLEFPPDRAVSVNDPTADDWVSDSVADRVRREEPDTVPGAEESPRLLAPNDVERDDEAQSIAEAGDAEPDLAAEEAAVHVEGEPG